MKRILLKSGVGLALVLALVLYHGQKAAGYIEVQYPLGKAINESTNVLLIVVESVDKTKNIIVYKKVRDIKGTHPGETIKHNIGQAGFHPREWQNVMAWAEVGKTALFIHNGGAAEVCIDNYWYQVNAGGEYWGMTHAEPFFNRTFCGKPEKLAIAVQSMLAGLEVVVPCMVDGDKNTLHLRTARMQRMKASLKIQDYNPVRDFVDFGSGGDELRSLAGMPGFSQTLNLGRVGVHAIGASSTDFNNDNRADVCVFGERNVLMLQNGGTAFDEVRLPNTSGTRAVAFADFNNDKKIDVFVAAPSGPKLYRNITEKAVQFEDATAALPRFGYSNLTAAAWIDYDGDGNPDLLVADGFRGLRLYRNLGAQPTPPPAPRTLGKWYYAGPFDGNFDKVNPPELSVDLKQEYTGKANEKVVWKEGTAFVDGQSNNLALFKPELNDNCGVYLYREINVGADMDCPASFGSDDTLTIWLNGEKIHSENVSRGCAPDQAIKTLKLRAGKNKLLIKICNGSGGFEFYFLSKLTEAQTAVALQFEDVSDKVGLGERGIGNEIKGDRLVVADVNGDGRPDFLFSGGTGLLVLNTPTGFVEATQSGIAYRTGDVTPVFGDFNGDGKPDLFIPQSGGCKLLRNDGAGHFTDVTAQSGDLAKSLGDARCAAWVEFKKGRPDLLVGCWKGPNHYLRKNGDGTFTDRTEDIGLTYRIFNTSAITVPDLNKDGTPDVVFNNEGQDAVLLMSNPEFFIEAPQPTDKSAPGKTLADVCGTSSYGIVFLFLGGFVLVAALIFLRRPSNGSKLIVFLALAWASAGTNTATAAAEATTKTTDWPTARGNAQRTGNVDDLPGPKQPNVLWIRKSQQHYVASPVPYNKALYSSVMGALNTGEFHALTLAANAAERMFWSKSAPFIVRPVVGSPAISDGMVIFGDGMHQTDDAVLYCVHPETGMQIWKYTVPGKLVHMEAGPTIDNGRVFVCGGSAGLLCLDAKHVTLDGKEMELAAAETHLKKAWTELEKQYEIEKKKDALLAIPPSEDSLPKAEPKLLWQQGKKKWHVDAPPVVVGDFVLVASAFLDDEKEGKRALICMKKSDGSIVWEAPLELNPWAGPTVAGQTVLVGCSSIRFDRKMLDKARGEVVAFDLANGQVKWRKQLGAGAVLSSIAVKGELAIYAGTDKDVVARNVNSGQRIWTYKCKEPFFAGVAIAGDFVYAVDLNANVHALNLADGTGVWDFELSADTNVQSKSMAFGSPVVHGGDVYVATCNPDGDTPQSSYVVCLSDKPSAIPFNWVPVEVDTKNRVVSIPCRIAPRKLAHLKDVYPLEVVATFPSPRGQKAHETLVVYDSKPSDVHKALESIGLKPGKSAVGDNVIGTGDEFNLLLEVPSITGGTRRIAVEKLMVDMRTGKTLPRMTWHFTGSVLRQPDPTKEEKVYGADLTGTLISLLPVTDETVGQLHLNMSDGKPLKLDANKDLLPAVGTEVRLIIQAK